MSSGELVPTSLTPALRKWDPTHLGSTVELALVEWELSQPQQCEHRRAGPIPHSHTVAWAQESWPNLLPGQNGRAGSAPLLDSKVGLILVGNEGWGKGMRISQS